MKNKNRRFNQTYASRLTKRRKKVRNKMILFAIMLIGSLTICGITAITTHKVVAVELPLVTVAEPMPEFIQITDVTHKEPQIDKKPLTEALNVQITQGENQVEVYVTAYSEYDSCHYPNCAMASGKRAYIGAVACPRNIKLGTKVLIDSVEYICEDRTATWVDGRYDIFMGYGQESYDKAINFGKQLKTVTIK